jgi:hypothetical protein
MVGKELALLLNESWAISWKAITDETVCNKEKKHCLLETVVRGKGDAEIGHHERCDSGHIDEARRKNRNEPQSRQWETSRPTKEYSIVH